MVGVFLVCVWLAGIPHFFVRFSKDAREAEVEDGGLAEDVDFITVAIMAIVWPIFLAWAVGRNLRR